MAFVIAINLDKGEDIIAITIVRYRRSRETKATFGQQFIYVRKIRHFLVGSHPEQRTTKPTHVQTIRVHQ